MFEFNV